MYKLTIAGLVLAILLAGAALSRTREEQPEFPKPAAEHAWLQQLVGEWTSDVQITMEPGQPAVASKGTESVRSVGGFWIVAENNGTMMDAPFMGFLTLGYDAEKKKYVGTWIDSMGSHLWNYTGSVSGKTLTLETEGPCPDAPGKLSKFKETLELKDKDHKLFTSSIQGDDGKWTTKVTINYSRTK